jgi:DNA-binding response OmpR family regulator
VLAEAAGRVLSRDELLKKMRGIEFDGLDRSIDNCISKLRRKFDDALSEKIKTVWGEVICSRRRPGIEPWHKIMPVTWPPAFAGATCQSR